MQSESKMGCYIGQLYVGVLVYTDDVTVLAPTPRAMRCQLKICEEYCQKYRVVFNAAKSACSAVVRNAQYWYNGMKFTLDGKTLHLLMSIVTKVNLSPLIWITNMRYSINKTHCVLKSITYYAIFRIAIH